MYLRLVRMYMMYMYMALTIIKNRSHSKASAVRVKKDLPNTTFAMALFPCEYQPL